MPQQLKFPDYRSHLYVVAALQHYIAGRIAYDHRLIWVMGHSSHHAIEFLLKAALLTCYTEEQLAEAAFGHNLQRLWREFKSIVQEPALSHYDAAIQRLDRFEDIRYPGWPKGMTVQMSYGPRKGHTVKTKGGGPDDKYAFILEEVDELFKVIVRLLPVNPEILRQHLERSKAVAIYKRDNLHQLW